MAYPAIKTAISGNQYFHRMEFAEAGDHIPTHEHTYDHVLQVLVGSLKVYNGSDDPVIVRAGDLFDVPAGVAHGMIALEPGTVAQCIHILRQADGSVVPFSYQLSAHERIELTGSL